MDLADRSDISLIPIHRVYTLYRGDLLSDISLTIFITAFHSSAISSRGDPQNWINKNKTTITFALLYLKHMELSNGIAHLNYFLAPEHLFCFLAPEHLFCFLAPEHLFCFSLQSICFVPSLQSICFVSSLQSICFVSTLQSFLAPEERNVCRITCKKRNLHSARSAMFFSCLWIDYNSLFENIIYYF